MSGTRGPGESVEVVLRAWGMWSESHVQLAKEAVEALQDPSPGASAEGPKEGQRVHCSTCGWVDEPSVGKHWAAAHSSTAPHPEEDAQEREGLTGEANRIVTDALLDALSMMDPDTAHRFMEEPSYKRVAELLRALASERGGGYPEQGPTGEELAGEDMGG